MLNGLAGLIFGQQNNGGVKQDENVPTQELNTEIRAEPTPEKTDPSEDEWIFIDPDLEIVSATDFPSFTPSEENSSRSSPVLLAEDDLGVMESSNFENLLTAETDGPTTGRKLRPGRISTTRALSNNRELVAELLLQGPFDVKRQQEAECHAKSRDFTQGKIKRANEVLNLTFNCKPKKQRKTRITQPSGRSNP